MPEYLKPYFVKLLLAIIKTCNTHNKQVLMIMKLAIISIL